jgi:benzoyl-CoA reductase subunit A
MSSLQVYVGIDLGSTTTKAIVLDASGQVLGRGITNSRSNYDVACRVAREEAFVRARFALTREVLSGNPFVATSARRFLPALERHFRLQQHLTGLARLRAALHLVAEAPRHSAHRPELNHRLDEVADAMVERAPALYSELAVRKSDFFRDLAAAEYMRLADEHSDSKEITFETLCGLFDAAILTVENTPGDGAFECHIGPALDSTLATSGAALKQHADQLRAAVESACSIVLDEAETVGTGYGRQRLPFPKEQIRSEILCHGLGAHALFPQTRTVLDIGGQDTKAIQIDSAGIVTSFQMNDRCAAGCGRYLGYIADEMNLGLHELGPLAQQSQCRVKINSTCTVFAGAELRERLSLGQNREDILAGLHRAIILRALSLLARSGGVSDEFTFTGGVARNPAAVAALRELVQENYGERVLNISPDSIYTGALGAALFARRGEYKGV